MTEIRLRRYSLIDAEITGHRTYGVSFRTERGESGFVDKADVSDVPTSPADWPLVGQVVTCVVLGIARDGRVRASARQSDVALARSVNDPDGALRRWIAIRDEGFANPEERAAFLASVESVPLLQWARRQRIGSADRIHAEELIADVSDEVRRRLE